MTLGTLDEASNDSAVNWCEATSSYGSGDLETPGTSMTHVPTLPYQVQVLVLET